MLGPTAIAFKYKIPVERQRELRQEGIFPLPDKLRNFEGEVGEQVLGIPYWKEETVEAFLREHPEEDGRRVPGS